MTSFRLAHGGLAHGGQIDRARPVAFTFDGASLTGFAGDTLASALLANGISLVGRSFKLHRPRGLLTADAASLPEARITGRHYALTQWR
jgi:methylglutamate dehydrogenase subunit C